MKDNIERLAEDLKTINESDAQEHGSWGYKEKAQCLISQGWIHKDQAVEYVSVCKACGGDGETFIEHADIDPKFCVPCSGKGVVPREGVRG